MPRRAGGADFGRARRSRVAGVADGLDRRGAAARNVFTPAEMDARIAAITARVEAEEQRIAERNAEFYRPYGSGRQPHRQKYRQKVKTPRVKRGAA